MDFLGIKNVIDAKAIYGKDGIADGFDILYKETRTHKWNGKVITKDVERRKTVWVREYNPNTGVSVKRKSAPKKVKKTVLNASGLASVNEILKR